MKVNHVFGLMMLLFLGIVFPAAVGAEEEEQIEENFDVPSHVLDISKENTVPNDSPDREVIEPSEETKELLETSSVPIDNLELIQQLNETTIKPSPIAFGYRGEIYLGRWPLQYESLETAVNWEYQHINTNERQSDGTQQEMNYIQQETKEVRGMLTNKIASADTVREMMLQKTEEKTNLPLQFETEVGRNTQLSNAYPVPADKYGVLEAYVPAVREKGQVTFGEVYIELKGSNKQLVIKNVTKQGVGAWIPVQNHVSYSFRIR
jgi:hypothetical protein